MNTSCRNFPRIVLAVALALGTVSASAGVAGVVAAATDASFTELRLVGTIDLPVGTAPDAAKQAVVLSLGRYRWMVQLVEDSRVIAFYARQPISVGLTIKLLPGKIEIWSQGRGPAAKLEKKEKEWISNLVKGVNESLGLISSAPVSAKNE